MSREPQGWDHWTGHIGEDLSGESAFTFFIGRLAKMTMAVSCWSEEEMSVLRSSLNLMPYKEIQALLPLRTIAAIKRRADLMNLRKNRSQMCSLSRRIVSVNREFFDVPGLVNSYWAGFIAADGCVIDHPRFELRLGVHPKDRGHIERFALDVGFNGQISEKTYERKEVRDGYGSFDRSARVVICSVPEWVSALANNFNVTPRKTFTLQPPKLLDRDCSLAFLAGLIDGDGCIHVSPEYRGRPRARTILVGTEVVLLLVQDLLGSIDFAVEKGCVRKNRGCFKYGWGHKATLQLYEAVRGLGLPLMKRKWSQLDSLKLCPTCGSIWRGGGQK
jgi:hypothetical protein